MHQIEQQMPPARVCCWCGLQQFQAFMHEPVVKDHGPYTPKHWVWDPSSAGTCEQHA